MGKHECLYKKKNYKNMEVVQTASGTYIDGKSMKFESVQRLVF